MKWPLQRLDINKLLCIDIMYFCQMIYGIKKRWEGEFERCLKLKSGFC